jgi:uncharacterized membrane protein
MDLITKKQRIILWSLLVIYVITTFAVNFIEVAVAGVVISTFAFSCYHGYIQYGLKKLLIFLALCLGVSFIMENLSVETGFPFGDYYYPEQLPGPRIGKVPILIGLAYFGTGYVSWVVAQIITGARFGNGSQIISKLSLPLAASFFMVIWDLCVDPTNSTMGKNWVWENGGAYFGVPLNNYLGWFLTVAIFYFGYAFYQFKTTQIIIKDKGYWLLGCYFYLVIGLAQVWPMFFQKYEWVKDGSGQAWFTGDLFKSASLVFAFTMLPIALIGVALIKGWIKPNQ